MKTAAADPNEINRCLHEYVGCWKRTADGKNYMFTSTDDPGVIYIPKNSPTFKLPTGETHTIQVNRPPLYSRVEVQTVDEFGHRVKNVTLTLESLDGFPSVEINTDDGGYGSLPKVLSGRYKVLVKGKGPAHFLKSSRAARDQSARPDYGDYEEAIIDTQYYVSAVTRVVVSRDTDAHICQLMNTHKQVYARTAGEESIVNRGTETTGLTRRSQRWAADNLAIAAGWADDTNIDIKALVTEILPGYFADYYATVVARHFYLLLLEPAPDYYEPGSTVAHPGGPRVTFVDEDGKIGKTFALNDFNFHALIGAYTRFEDIDGELLLDLATASDGIYPGSNEGQEGSLATIFGAPPSLDSGQILYLEDHVDDAATFVQEENKRAGKVPIVYWMPSAGALGLIALHGGTGVLEEYSDDADLDGNIHARNLLTCKHIAEVYRKYVNSYMARLDDIQQELLQEEKKRASFEDIGKHIAEISNKMNEGEWLGRHPEYLKYSGLANYGIMLGNALKKCEIQIAFGYVGTSRESILAVVSKSPGFFQQRDINELFDPKTHWSDLNLDEVASLVKLGWNSSSWDFKYIDQNRLPEDWHIPKSATKSELLLTNLEKIGIVHLGFRRNADYRETVQHMIERYGEK